MAVLIVDNLFNDYFILFRDSKMSEYFGCDRYGAVNALNSLSLSLFIFFFIERKKKTNASKHL